MTGRQSSGSIALTVVVTVVSGGEALRRCLESICDQADFGSTEVIVPFDPSCKELEDLEPDFPGVIFHYFEDQGLGGMNGVSARDHRLYDRRRAEGLALARGEIVAMTEDHAVPADDWCSAIIDLHSGDDPVVGGAIENAVDRNLNWAQYFCDFGRYGRPLAAEDAEYVSDTNVAYKREALIAVRDVWENSYSETSVHWKLREIGMNLRLDERMLVFQRRPEIELADALRERIEWGRVFAETRAEKLGLGGRIGYAAGTLFLAPVLTFRALSNMYRQRRGLGIVLKVLPLVFLLNLFWSAGELAGYVNGRPAADPSAPDDPGDEPKSIEASNDGQTSA